MTLTQWTAEMTKMQHTYGAPIDDTEVKLLGIYLAATYGDASTVTAADRAMTARHRRPDSASPVDCVPAAGAGPRRARCGRPARLRYSQFLKKNCQDCEMPEYLDRLFSSAGFMPHGMCYQWQAGILALHVIADSLIALAYFSIPVHPAVFRPAPQRSAVQLDLRVFRGVHHRLRVDPPDGDLDGLGAGLLALGLGQGRDRAGFGPDRHSAGPAHSDGVAPAESCCAAACQSSPGARDRGAQTRRSRCPARQ